MINSFYLMLRSLVTVIYEWIRRTPREPNATQTQRRKMRFRRKTRFNPLNPRIFLYFEPI